MAGPESGRIFCVPHYVEMSLLNFYIENLFLLVRLYLYAISNYLDIYRSYLQNCINSV